MKRDSRGYGKAHGKLWLVAAICLATASATYAHGGGKAARWATGGEDLGNTRNNEHVNLKPKDVKNIELAWSYNFRGDPWTQPTSRWGKVFMGDTAGWIYALDGVTGALLWERQLTSYWDDNGGVNATNEDQDPNDPENIFPNPKPDMAATRSAIAARRSPVHGRVLYFGDQAGNPTLPGVPLNGANIYMVNANNGDLIKMTKVAQTDDLDGDGNHPAQSGSDYTVLTGAMALNRDTLITGVAGLAEANPGCQPLTAGGCTLRGRVMAFNADTLELKWETYTTPAVEGYTGASVWQSTPAISRRHNMVYVGTGDNYTTPYDECYIAIEKDGKSRAEIEAEFMTTCIAAAGKEAEWAQNFVDSILALDLDTGEIKWSMRTLMYDTWNLACFSAPNGWLNTCGPDMDFSHHPMLCPTKHGKKVLVVGQKTGEMRGINPKTGELLWITDGNKNDIFQDGLVGGFQWGAACTDKRIIGLAANSYSQEHITKKGDATYGGTLVGMDPKNGKVKFEVLPDTADVVHAGLQADAAGLRGLTFDAAGTEEPATIGAASCAGGVCGWGTSGVHGSLILSNAKNGKTLWTRDTANGSVLWGGAFVKLRHEGTFWYVGSGYGSFNTGVSSKADATTSENDNFWAYSFSKKKKHDEGKDRD